MTLRLAELVLALAIAVGSCCGIRPTSTPAPSSSPSPVPSTSPTPRPSSAPVARHRLAGIGSWGDGWSGVVTRLPRGTRICVTAKLGRWCGRSTGYGPAVWTGRIADLSRAVFVEICGPLSAGLCPVVVTW